MGVPWRASAPPVPTRSPPATPPSFSLPFRFLDLPPEIRAVTYVYILASYRTRTRYITQGVNKYLVRVPVRDRIYDLADMREPAITSVCQLLRTESLPVFFGECTFSLLVGSDLGICALARIEHRCVPRTLNSEAKRAGTLGIKRSTMKLLRAAGTTAVFRHINFTICAADQTRVLRASNMHPFHHAWRPEVQDLGSLVLGWQGGQVSTSSVSRVLRGGLQIAGVSVLAEDVQATLKDAKTVAESISEREGFIGSALSDRDKVAKAFRFAGRRG